MALQLIIIALHCLTSIPGLQHGGILFCVLLGTMLQCVKFVREFSVERTLAIAANVEVLWTLLVITITGTVEITENQQGIHGLDETSMMSLKH